MGGVGATRDVQNSYLAVVTRYYITHRTLPQGILCEYAILILKLFRN